MSKWKNLTKRGLSLFMALVMCVGLLQLSAFAAGGAAGAWDGTTVATEFAGGSGTETDPYQIATGAQLAHLKDFLGPNHGRKFYRLTADIDLGGQLWTPIGNGVGYDAFQGTLIGNGHTISNLNVSQSSGHAGLFGYIASAEICDMTISNATVSGKSAGAFVGTVSGSANLCNLHLKDSTVTSTHAAGGIVGEVASSSGYTATICCSSTEAGVTVKATTGNGYGFGAHAGGIVGDFSGSGGTVYIRRSYCTADSVTSGNGCAGGILGSSAQRCDSTAPVFHISDCYNTAAVGITGSPIAGKQNAAGGIAGFVWNAKADIKYCYNTGTISTKNGTNASYAAGIGGYGTGLTYQNCVNFGTVTTTNATASRKPTLGTISNYGGTVSSCWYVANCLDPNVKTTYYTKNANGTSTTLDDATSKITIICQNNGSGWLLTGDLPTLKRCVPADATECTCEPNCKCHCAPYTGSQSKHLTDITKALATDEETGSVALPAGVTLSTKNADGKYVADAEGNVTLLYKITVTGDEGAAYIVTDEGAAWVSGGDAHEVKPENEKQVLYVTGTLGAEDAVIYVIKTFVVKEAGKVSNTAYLKAGDDNTDLTHTDPEKEIEDGKLPVTSDPVDVIPAANPALTDITKALMSEQEARDAKLETTGITFPGSDGKVTLAADQTTAKLLYKITVKGESGANYTVKDDGATRVGGDLMEDTLGEKDAVIYVTKTFTEDQIKKGEVTNTAYVKPGDNTDLAPSDPDKKPDEEKGLPSNPVEPDVTQTPNVEITKELEDKTKTSYTVNDTIVWTITVTNHGLFPLDGLKVVDALVGNDAAVTITPPAGVNKDDFSLAPGASVEFEASVTAAAAGTYKNHAEVQNEKNEKLDEVETNDANSPVVNEPASNPKLTGITKTQLDEAPAGVTLPTGVTLSRKDADNKYVADADGKVTLLYQITVTGEKNAKYIVTDDGATRVGGAEMTGTLGEEDAVIYVVKTFTKDQVQNGQVTNTAYVKPDGDKTDLNPSDPDKKPDDDGKLPSDPVNTDVTPASYDLEVKKTMEDSRASNIPENEEWVTFTVTVTNNSNQPLYNLMLVDTMDKTLEFVPETIQVQVTGNDGNTNKVEFKGTEEFLEPVRNDKDRIVWNAEGGVTRKTDGEKKWDSTWTLAGAFQPNAVLTLTYDARILYGDAATVEFYNYADALAGTKPDDQPKYDGDQIAEMRAGGSLQMDLIHYEFIGGGSGSVGSGSGGSGPIGETRTKYKLTYDFAGGMLGNASSYVDQTKGLTAASHTFYVDGNIQPEREGFTFVGWTNQAGTATYPAGEEIIVLRSSPERTIYAKWTPKQPDTVTVTFNPNGGSWGGITDSLTRSTTKGGTLTNVPTNPTKGDDLFLGWFTAADNSGVKVDDPATAIFDKDTTLYAHWQTRYTYTLNCYDGGTQLAGSPHTYGPTTDTAHTFAVTNPSKTGFTFQGWAETEDGDVVYSVAAGVDTIDITLTSTAPKTVYAVWQETEKVTVTYQDDNGNTLDTETVEKGTEITIKDDTGLTAPDGKEFAGWEDEAGNTYEPGQKIRPEEDLILKPVWKDEAEYAVTYDWGTHAPSNGDTAPVDPNGYTKGSDVTALPPSVTNETVGDMEYTFAGWLLSTGTVVKADEVFTMPGSDVTLTAIWSEKSVSENPGDPDLPDHDLLASLIRVVVECDNSNHAGTTRQTVDLLEDSYDLVRDANNPYVCRVIIKPEFYRDQLGDDHTDVRIANQVITLNFVSAGQEDPAMLEEVQEDLEIPEVTLPEIPAQDATLEDTILPEESDSQEEVLVEPSADLEGNKTLEEQTEENADLEENEEENADLQENEEENADLQENETTQELETTEVYNANAPEGSWVLADGADSVTVTVTVHCDAAAPDTTYTLRYNANGGNGTLPPSQTVTAPSGSAHSAVVGSGNGLTLSGYTFQGWSTTPTGGVNYRPGNSINLTGDVTLYAVWTQNTPTTPTTPPTGGNTGTGGGGGGGRPGTNPTNPGAGNTTTIGDTEVPLAGDLQLNKTDHFAYIKGYQDGTVRPNNPITRAQVATIFYRLLDETSRVIYFQETNDFTDVANDYWANKAISTLTNAGIITGFSDGTFRPNAYITRAQFAAIAARFDNVVPGLNNPFTDVAEDYWARDLIAFAADRGWITGESGKFRPLENITRVEVMDFINNVLERHVDEQGLLENATKWSDVPVTDPNYYVVEEATNSHDYTRRTEGQLMENWTQLNPDPVWDE